MSDNQKQFTESLERQANLQIEFVNLCHEDMLSNAVGTKKNAKRKIATPECDVEGAMGRLKGPSTSFAYIIKKAAIERYPKYFNLSYDERSIVSLGLNSILDLSFEPPHGQSIAFEKEEWEELLRRYSTTDELEKLELPKKAKRLLNEVNSIASKNPKKAANLLYQYLYNHELSDETSFILFTYAFLIDYTVNYKYMFDEKCCKNEQDYIVKLWSQILERLVRNSGLRLKWGESGFARIDYSSYMADMRVIIDNHQNEYDLMCVEVSKGSPAEVKLHHDHCKLLIETKDILDNSPVAVPSIPSVQFCGHELFAYSLTHHADNLYIAKKTSYAFVPPKVVNLNFCEQICRILLSLKTDWVTYQQMMENKLNKEKKRYAFNTKEPDDEAGYKTSPSWYPPHLTQKSGNIMPLPDNLV